jgi:hypothetical protein
LRDSLSLCLSLVSLLELSHDRIQDAVCHREDSEKSSDESADVGHEMVQRR